MQAAGTRELWIQKEYYYVRKNDDRKAGVNRKQNRGILVNEKMNNFVRIIDFFNLNDIISVSVK
jgi:hypothetical protein